MKLRIKNNDQRDDFIKKVQATDVKVAYRAEWTKVVRPRSLNQNSYLWLCLAIAQDETGTDKGVYYQYYLEKFPTLEVRQVFGEDVIIQLSSSQFNSKQMTEFIDKIRNDLNENLIFTPDADDKRLQDIFEDMQNRGVL
jgi:hypothetical protein